MKKLMNLNKQMIINVNYSEYSDSPREWDNLWNIYTWQGRYYSIDRNDFSDGKEFIASILGDELEEKIHEKYNNSEDYLNDVIKRLDKKGIIALPVSCYEHSCVKYYAEFSSGWDCGTVGIAWIKKENLLNEYGGKIVTKKIKEKALSILKGELEEYTQYANGEVYEYSVENLNGEFLDSLCSIYSNIYHNEKELLDCVYENTDNNLLGKREDWEEYSQEKINNTFEFETIITRK